MDSATHHAFDRAAIIPMVSYASTPGYGIREFSVFLVHCSTPWTSTTITRGTRTRGVARWPLSKVLEHSSHCGNIFRVSIGLIARYEKLIGRAHESLLVVKDLSREVSCRTGN